MIPVCANASLLSALSGVVHCHSITGIVGVFVFVFVRWWCQFRSIPGSWHTHGFGMSTSVGQTMCLLVEVNSTQMLYSLSGTAVRHVYPVSSHYVFGIPQLQSVCTCHCHKQPMLCRAGWFILVPLVDVTFAYQVCARVMCALSLVTLSSRVLANPWVDSAVQSRPCHSRTHGLTQ